MKGPRPQTSRVHSDVQHVKAICSVARHFSMTTHFVATHFKYHILQKQKTARTCENTAVIKEKEVRSRKLSSFLCQCLQVPRFIVDLFWTYGIDCIFTRVRNLLKFNLMRRMRCRNMDNARVKWKIYAQLKSQSLK
jgi:hypothetical protein